MTPTASPNATGWQREELIEQRDKFPDHFTVHCLRHTFATLHLEADQGRLLDVSTNLGTRPSPSPP